MNVAGVLPLFDTVNVHVKDEPRATVPPTLFVLVIVRSGPKVTVTLSLFEVTPSAEAEAIFVTCFAATSLAETECVAEQVRLSPGSR